MALFFADDKILFLPKDQRLIERDLRALDGTKDRYHTQEVGIYYKIIDQLKLHSSQEEERYLSVYHFIMSNSKVVEDKVPGWPGKSDFLLQRNPTDWFLRDGNGALRHLGVHRDTTIEAKSSMSVEGKLNFFKAANSTLK